MATVQVGCKLPHGLQCEINGERLVLNGQNSSAVIGGYGVTEVDEDLIGAWLTAEAKNPLVKKEIIFVVDKESKVKGAAKERSEVKTGLEPLDPTAAKQV